MQISLGQSVAWDAVPSAVSYTVELLNAAAGSVLATFGTSATSITAVELLAGKLPGNFNVRVKAISDTLESPFSALLPLEFVGLSAPTNLRVV